MKRLLKRGKESGRSDDNEETISNRINVYQRQTIPVTRYYDKTKIHHPVEGIGKINQIFKRIVDVVEKNK